jgi:hypothetical protein
MQQPGRSSGAGRPHCASRFEADDYGLSSIRWFRWRDDVGRYCDIVQRLIA